MRGRLSGPKRIELDEPLDEASGEVEVVVRRVQAVVPTKRDVFDVLPSIAQRARSKADIDRQIADERSSSGDR